MLGEPGASCDAACMSIGAQCDATMFWPTTATEVMTVAAAAGVNCQTTESRCDMGECPLFGVFEGECSYCASYADAGYNVESWPSPGGKCDAAAGGRARLCPCGASSPSPSPDPPTNGVVFAYAEYDSFDCDGNRYGSVAPPEPISTAFFTTPSPECTELTPGSRSILNYYCSFAESAPRYKADYYTASADCTGDASPVDMEATGACIVTPEGSVRYWCIQLGGDPALSIPALATEIDACVEWRPHELANPPPPEESALPFEWPDAPVAMAGLRGICQNYCCSVGAPFAEPPPPPPPFCHEGFCTATLTDSGGLSCWDADALNGADPSGPPRSCETDTDCASCKWNGSPACCDACTCGGAGEDATLQQTWHEQCCSDSSGRRLLQESARNERQSKWTGLASAMQSANLAFFGANPEALEKHQAAKARRLESHHTRNGVHG